MPRIARTRIPQQYAQQYFREVRRLLMVVRRRVYQAFQEEIRPRIHEYRHVTENPQAGRLAGIVAMNSARASIRVNDSMDDIRRILNRLRDTSENQTFNVTMLERIIRQFVEQTDRQTKANFRRQVQRVMGFDPTANEPWLSSFLNTAVQENVSWIKSISTEYHDRIESIVMQGVRRGQSINDMASAIADVGDVSIRRARFIARDQMGSLHGDLVKRRQEGLGLKRFTWRSSQDERVRDSHAELDGQVFTWADGARNERGEQIWPGTDYNCRCVAEPLLEELLEVADDG